MWFEEQPEITYTASHVWVLAAFELPLYLQRVVHLKLLPVWRLYSFDTESSNIKING
jgi:hypothetical protein